MNDSDERIWAVMEEARQAGDVYREVPDIDGRMLRLLTEAVNAKNVVEIGTSTGYSGMWFCLALRRTGGHLTTFEMDAGRASRARKHFEQAGVDQMITIIEGNAHQNLTRWNSPIDILFIDADKEGYIDYFQKLSPLVRPGGLILAHNTDMVPDYVNLVTTAGDLETVLYKEGKGLAITLKPR